MKNHCNPTACSHP